MMEFPKVGIGVIVAKDGKVLLGKRIGAHGAHSWSFPGGHLEFNEEIEACAIREVLEETGIKIKNLKRTAFTNDIFNPEGKHYITIFVLAEPETSEVRNMEPEKCECWQWFDWSSLPQPLFLPVQNLVKQGYSPFKTEKPQAKVGFGVMILKDNKVLLGKRHPDPEKASSALHGEGTWTMPGGKLRFGETFEAGAKREVAEETGMAAKSFSVVSLTNNIVTDAHFVTIGLLCRDFEGEPKVMEPDEITEWRWFHPNELPSPIYPASEQVLKNFSDKAIYKH